MRVTEARLYQSAARNLAQVQERLQRATEQAATGVRVAHPGDDPAAAALAVAHRVARARFDAVRQGCLRAYDELALADGALDGLGNLLTRARELAVQFANDSYNAGQRALGAPEVLSLRDQAIALLNTSEGGRYLFGGTADSAPPFDAGGYRGSSAVRQVEIAPGIFHPSSIRMDVAVAGAEGGVDALAALGDLARALQTNDVDGIRAGIGTMEKAIAQVALARTQAGAAMAVFKAGAEAATTARDAAEAATANLLDADAIEAAGQLALAQHGVQAALTASAQSLRLTLLEVIG